MTHNSMLTMIAVLAFAILGVAASDIYAPVLPTLHQYFGTTTAFIQMTVTVYFIGLTITPLIAGPLSDAYGRRPVMLSAALIALIGSIICAQASSLTAIIVGRILQGIGLGTAISLGRTIARDLFEGKQLAKVAASLSLIMGFAPVIAPLLGSYLQATLGWRSIFYFLLIYLTLISIWLYFILPETVPQRQKLAIKIIAHDYYFLCKNLPFMANTLATATGAGILISFFITAPFLFQNVLKLSVLAYGWIITGATAMSLISRMINILLLKKFDSAQIVLIGLISLLLGSVGLLLVGVMKILTIVTLLVPAMFLVFGTGLIFSNAMVGALEPFKKTAGAAGALYGGMQMLGGFIASAIASHLNNNLTWIAAELLTLSGLAILLISTSLIKLRSSHATHKQLLSKVTEDAR